MRQPELTSLIGLRDSDGDRLLLLRLDRPNGTRGYMLKVGTGSVFLTAGDHLRSWIEGIGELNQRFVRS